MAYIMVSGAMVVLALGQSASHKLATHYYAGDRRAFCGLFGKLICFAAFCGLLGIGLALVAGQEVLTLLYSHEYATRTDVFLTLMIAAAILYIVSSYNFALVAVRYFRTKLLLLMLTSFSILLLSAILVPQEGLRGAAWALVGGFLIHVTIASLILMLAISKLGEKQRGKQTTGSCQQAV